MAGSGEKMMMTREVILQGGILGGVVSFFWLNTRDLESFEHANHSPIDKRGDHPMSQKEKVRQNPSCTKSLCWLAWPPAVHPCLMQDTDPRMCLYVLAGHSSHGTSSPRMYKCTTIHQHVVGQKQISAR